VIDSAWDDFRLKHPILWDNEADAHKKLFPILAAFDCDRHLLGGLCGFNWKLD
jgi:hypothetical protein